jgi:hypothetical protein
MPVSLNTIADGRSAGHFDRRHPRAIFSVPINVRMLMPGGVHNTRGVSLDLSESGIGALVEGQLQVGDTVGIDLQFPDYPLRAVAIVRHTSNVRSGLEFVGLTAEERGHLAGIVGST